MQQVKAVVAMAKGAPVELVTINVPDPGPGEAVVKVQACGVCHTDLHYREGGINDDFPFLLGHEAAGVVEAVGPDVTGLEPGDFVVLNWRAVCGDCRACNRGEPWYCFATFNATQKMTLEDGTELSPALGIGAFAEKTLVAAGQCTKVDPSARPAAVGLLGCGVMAGIGAAINTGGVTRGKSVAVIGCGGVGVAAVAGSALAGASPIIAVDIDAKKLEAAKRMGATHTVDSSSTDPVAAIQELTGGFGADVVIEAVGRPETWQQAFYARDLAGTVVLVGVPTPDMKVPDLPLIDIFGRGGSLKSSWYGDCLPTRDFPMLVDLYLQGRLDLDAFVSEEIGIGDIEAAFEKMHQRRRAAFGGRPLMSGVRPGRPRRQQRHVLARRRDLRRRQQHLGGRRRRRVRRHRRAALGRRHPRRRRRPHGEGDPAHPRPRRPLPGRAGAARGAVVAPIFLHPDDKPLWELTHTDYLWDLDLPDGWELSVAGTTIRTLHTPGHAPGACCFLVEDLGCVFTGDTLFQGGPGATGRSFSDRPTLEASIRAKLFPLPDDTVVHTGHGDDTTIGAERADSFDWD